MVANLAVRKLMVSNFRNYVSARMEIATGPVVLTGDNGAGKTNLLEAVSMLAPGRGLRRAKTSDLDRLDGGQPWAVAATVDSLYGEVDLGTGRDRDSERRLVKINGASARSQAALAEYVNIVWLTPQMDGLFLEGSGARRRFLDRLIYGFDAAHAGRLNAYEKALRDRARLLKTGQGDDAWLGALETQMVERGIAIAAARRDMVARLDLACKAAAGPFPGASVAVEGQVEDWLGTLPAVEAEDRFATTLISGRSKDRDHGGASVGPHKSDMAVTHLGKSMPAHLCSTGEQKAVLIAIVLAHAKLQAAEKGAPPILLLDEVAAHLDPERREALYGTLLGLNSQSWLTGTDVEIFDGLSGKARFFKVKEADVRPMADS